MASTFFGLTIAYSGLQASQIAINTTAHNISNLNTKGYSRQQASVQAGNALRAYSSYGTLGTGVVVSAITQLRDSYYDVKYRSNKTNLGEYAAKNNYMTQIEDYLNEFTLNGFTAEYESFFLSVKELQKSPTEASVQNSVINNAQSLAQYFNTLSTNLTNVQRDCNEEIKNQVNEINTIAQNIASLNKQINQVEASNGTANDLRDQRNNLLDELSQIINIETEEQQIGNGLTSFSVKINGQLLVNTYDYNTLATQAKAEPRNASDADGMYEITWSNGLNFDEYSLTLHGNLKGLLDIRDGCNNSLEVEKTDIDGNKYLELESSTSYNTTYKGIPHYVSKLNEFIQVFTSSVNEILTSGKTADGADGIPMFEIKYDNSPMSALSVTVNQELVKSPFKLATTTDPTKGDAYCDIVDKLIELQESEAYEGGTGTYFLESIVAEVGIDSEKATTFEANFTNIETTVQNQRLSVMGVDEDEEGMDVMKFQHAYDLASQMMSVLNQIYDKLINEMGL